MADSIGTRIMKLRGQNETQQQLADSLGVSRSLVKAWENNDRPIRSDDLAKLASHYGVSADYLLGLSEYKTSDFNLRNACEFTGLSETAMHQLKEMKGYALSDLSEMLENEKFRSIVSSLDDLRAAYNHCVPIMNLVLMIKAGVPFDDPEIISAIDEAALYLPDDEPHEENLTDDALEEFADRYSDLRMQVFELNEMWSDYLESFIPTRELLAEGKEIYRGCK